MALPQKLIARNVPLGSDSFEKRQIQLFASAANSTTKYRAGDRILFDFPNYPRSFIDFSQSYIKFNVRVRSTTGKCRVNNSLPVFSRVTTRIGSKTVEDVDGYHNLQRILEVCTKKEQDFTQLYGDYTSTLTDLEVNEIQDDDTNVGLKFPYIKRLYTGLFNQENYLFPIHALNSGNSLQLELQLAPNAIALKQCNGTAVTGEFYELSEVMFQLTLLKVSDSFYNKFNSLKQEIVLPMTSYRRHLSSIPDSQSDSTIFVNDNAKNLKRCYTIFTKEPTAVGVNSQPLFLKSAIDSTQLVELQYRYGSRNFPENPLQCTTGKHNNFLAHLLTNIGHYSMSDDLPAIIHNYDKYFVVAQDFTYSTDDMINGLNLNNSGAPLILTLKFDTSGVGSGCSVETFTESSLELVIDPSSGVVNTVQRSNMTVE